MKPVDPKPSELEARVSEQTKRRKEISAFLWGTWIMLFGAVALGHNTLEGIRTGQWVDISSKGSGLLVPWWVAAAMALGFLLFSLWCFGEYLKLKMTRPK